MAIKNITTGNTFGQWITATQQLVSLANNLTDGPYLYCNTQLQLAGANTTLNVSNGALFSGNIIANGVNATLNVTNNVYVGNVLTVRNNIVAENANVGTLLFSKGTSTAYLNVANLSVANTTVVKDVTSTGLLTFNTAITSTGTLYAYDLIVANLAYIPNVGITSATFDQLAANYFDAGQINVTTLYFTTGRANTGSLSVYDLTVLNSTNTKSLLVLANLISGNIQTSGTINTSTLLFTTGRANTGSLSVSDLTALNSTNTKSLLVLANTTTGNLVISGTTNTSTLQFTTGRANTGSLSIYDITASNTINSSIMNTSTLQFTTGRATTGSLTVYDLIVLNGANLNSMTGIVADPVAMSIALG